MITALFLIGLYGEAVRWVYNPPQRPPKPLTVPVVEADGWIVDVPVKGGRSYEFK